MGLSRTGKETDVAQQEAKDRRISRRSLCINRCIAHSGVWLPAEGVACLDNSQYGSLLRLRFCAGSIGSIYRYLGVICDSINMTLIRQKANPITRNSSTHRHDDGTLARLHDMPESFRRYRLRYRAKVKFAHLPRGRSFRGAELTACSFYPVHV